MLSLACNPHHWILSVEVWGNQFYSKIIWFAESEFEINLYEIVSCEMISYEIMS